MGGLVHPIRRRQRDEKIKKTNIMADAASMAVMSKQFILDSRYFPYLIFLMMKKLVESYVL